jgi:signal transduction histidine kinase
VAILGILLLFYYISSVSRENRETGRQLRDLQERQLALEQINEQTQQLAHHQRLQTIGTLTSSIAHEFNNLLTPIMGYSLMALEKLPPEEEELYDNILEVYNASRTAKNLISRLSDLSRKNTDATFRMASPDDLVRRTVEVASPAKPENVEIRLDLSCQDQRLKVNEIQIQQLMLNLILNAFQAMEGKGGILTVKTSFDDRNVYLRVKDTGCGISEENRARIFDPFFTTKESGRGTGLGLAIAAQVAEDHQGSIRVDSRVGEGTAFTVKLPRDR